MFTNWLAQHIVLDNYISDNNISPLEIGLRSVSLTEWRHDKVEIVRLENSGEAGGRHQLEGLLSLHSDTVLLILAPVIVAGNRIHQIF